MKLEEIIAESNLEEGPILNKIGQGIGKASGTVAKGVGAVAGGVAGLGSAFKKGYQAGRTQVAKAGDEEEPTTAEPAANVAPDTTTATPTAQTTATAAPKKPASAFSRLSAAARGEEPGTTTAQTTATAAPTAAAATAPAATATQATPAATKPQSQPAAQQPVAPASPAAQAKADTAYAQAQKAIMSLQPADRQKIIATLKSDPKVKAALAQPKTTAKPAQPPVTAQNPTAATKTPKQAGQGLTPKLAREEPATKPAAAAPVGDVEVLPTDKFNPNTGEPIKQNPAQEPKKDEFTGIKFDGETGEMTPEYRKYFQSLSQKRHPAAAAPVAEPAAAASSQTATSNADDEVGQAATTAHNASNANTGAAEKAALAAMTAKNPKLAGMMKQAGMNNPAATTSTPQNKIKITGAKPAAKRVKPAIQTAGKENLGKSLNEKIEEYKKLLTD